MRRGLVLGGGGLVGMAYHAGVLKALDDFGIDAGGSEVIVGTSAGSVMASYLGIGWKADDFYEYGHGRHPTAVKRPEDNDPSRPLFDPLSRSPGERVRRAVGSTFAVASARGLWPSGKGGKRPSGWLRKTFPAGIYSSERSLQRLSEDLPEEWPHPRLYICAADLYSGERVVFGHPTAPAVPLPLAVLASTSIPGFFPPVRIGDRQYVDGGIVSATSLDVAADAGCDTIICVAPLGFRRDHQPTDVPRLLSPMFVRGLFARKLAREVRAARERDIEVLVIRPWTSELLAQGTNSMKHFDRGRVIEAAREGTARLLEEHADHPAVIAALKRSEARTG